MLYDYRTQRSALSSSSGFFRKYQPPTLIVWGKNDYIFPPEGATPLQTGSSQRRDAPLDTGHFALETHGEEIASRIENFFRHPR